MSWPLEDPFGGIIADAVFALLGKRVERLVGPAGPSPSHGANVFFSSLRRLADNNQKDRGTGSRQKTTDEIEGLGTGFAVGHVAFEESANGKRLCKEGETVFHLIPEVTSTTLWLQPVPDHEKPFFGAQCPGSLLPARCGFNLSRRPAQGHSRNYYHRVSIYLLLNHAITGLRRKQNGLRPAGRSWTGHKHEGVLYIILYDPPVLSAPWSRPFKPLRGRLLPSYRGQTWKSRTSLKDPTHQPRTLTILLFSRITAAES